MNQIDFNQVYDYAIACDKAFDFAFAFAGTKSYEPMFRFGLALSGLVTLPIDSLIKPDWCYYKTPASMEPEWLVPANFINK